MKILTKYILKEFVKPLIGTILAFAVLFALSETFRIINITNKAPEALSYIPFYLLFKTPVWLTRIFPMTILLAFLFSYNNLVRHNEVTAVKAGGININALIKPIILFSLCVSLFMLIGNSSFLPKLNQRATFYYRTQILGHEQKVNLEYKDIVYLGRNNRKYIIKRFDVANNTLENINIDGFDKKLNVTEHIYGEKAVWNGKDWIFHNGLFRKFDPVTKQVINEITFKEKIINLPEKPNNFIIEKKNDDSMSILEIKDHVDRLKRNSLPSHKKATQMHLKIAFPFSTLIVILIGIAFTSSNIRSNKVISFAISLVISFIYWGLLSVGIALGENRVFPPFIAAWITNILFMLGSLYFIRKMKR